VIIMADMNEKLKECFKPHVMMHSLFGLGLGFILVSLIPGLGNFWLGLVVAGVAVALDYTRK